MAASEPAKAKPMPVANLQPQSLGCLIEPDRVMDLGSPVIGVLQEVLVERGQLIKKGDVVARLQSEVERNSVVLARARADANAQMAAAQASWQLAKRKHERIKSLVAQNFMSEQAADQAGAEAEVALRTYSQMKEQQQLSEREWHVAQAQFDQRVVRSPIDGVVVEKYMSAGERVDEKPIVRVAAIDQLKVEAILASQMYSKVAIGMTATVTPDLSGTSPRTASITSIDRVLDAASNTFRVRLKLDNTDQPLPAGVRCAVSFSGVMPPAATGTASNSNAVTGTTRSASTGGKAKALVPRTALGSSPVPNATPRSAERRLSAPSSTTPMAQSEPLVMAPIQQAAAVNTASVEPSSAVMPLR